METKKDINNSSKNANDTIKKTDSIQFNDLSIKSTITNPVIEKPTQENSIKNYKSIQDINNRNNNSKIDSFQEYLKKNIEKVPCESINFKS